MPDIVSKQKRSWMMSRVRDRDTKPEKLVRSTLHNMGFRFRLHKRDLPGKPDIVFPGRKKAIFVHGCFWHQHEGCPRSARPASNQSFWDSKLDENTKRDIRQIEQLWNLDWEILIIWECETEKKSILLPKLSQFLNQI